MQIRSCLDFPEGRPGSAGHDRSLDGSVADRCYVPERHGWATWRLPVSFDHLIALEEGLQTLLLPQAKGNRVLGALPTRLQKNAFIARR